MTTWWRNHWNAMRIVKEAVERVKTLSDLYSGLVEKYIQLLDENTRLKLEQAENARAALAVDELMSRHRPAKFIN